MAETELTVEVGNKATGCTAYDVNDGHDPYTPVHLVADEHLASQRVAANCGAVPVHSAGQAGMAACLMIDGAWFA